MREERKDCVLVVDLGPFKDPRVLRWLAPRAVFYDRSVEVYKGYAKGAVDYEGAWRGVLQGDVIRFTVPLPELERAKEDLMAFEKDLWPQPGSEEYGRASVISELAGALDRLQKALKGADEVLRHLREQVEEMWWKGPGE